MSQPPYPPDGGNEPRGDPPGYPGWNPQTGADDPTRRFGPAGEGQREQTQQFGQPGQYGQPEHGPPGQPQYAQPQYGQPAQPQYGQPQYGQPPGQSPYGQPQYGQPWGPPGGEAPKTNRNTLIALAVAGVVVLAAIAVGMFLVFRGGDAGPANASIPPATMEPDGLGSDPALDQLAQDCYDGDMQACDDLYKQSEVDSPYELYGGTCAGRQDIGDSDIVYCTTAFPGD